MSAKCLVLMRHAKSSWADPDLVDHDRPLSSRGRRAAAAVGRRLGAEGLRPDLVLCSSARRARQTLVLLELGPDRPVLIEDRLYGASGPELLSRVRRVPDEVHSLVLIAHNPGVEDLARLLAGAGNDLAGADKFPTGAVADLRLPGGPWADVAPGGGRLRAFLVPRQLVS